MGSVYEVFRVNPGGAYMQWLFIMFFLVAMPTMSCGFVQTKEYISELDMLIPITQVTGVFGKSGSLPCDIQPLSADDRVMKVLWFKGADEKPIYSYDVLDRSTNLPKLWSSPTGFGSRAFFRATTIPSTFQIDNITTNDAGLYRCRVDFKNSSVRNFKVNFTVIISITQVTGVFGKSGSLPCDIQPLSADDRVMKVLWFKGADEKPIYSYDVLDRSTNLPKLWSSPTGFGSRAFFRATTIPSTLQIDNITTNDAGLYRCRVDFKNSSVRNFKVNFTVIIPITQVAGVFGKSGSLPCDIQPLSADDRVMKVLWFKGADEKPIYSYDVRDRSTNLPKLWSSPTGFGSRAFFRATTIPSNFQIDNITTNDAGLYRCRVDFKNSSVRNFKVNFTVIIPITQVAGVFGKSGSLPCDIQPLSADDRVMKVLWFKGADAKPIYSYDVRDRSTNLPKLWSSPTGFGSRAFFRATTIPSTFQIVNITTNDAGLYRCRVDFKNSSVRHFKVNFTVIIPPNRPIIMEAKTKDPTRLLGPYNEGDTLELLCVVDGGYPRPSLIWYLEKTIIDDTSELKDDGVTVNTLIIPSISRQHLNLRLICEASNTNLAPPQSKLLILDINLKPLTVQILNKQKRLSADSSYVVECKTTGSRPEAQVTWWKGTLPLRTNIKTYWDTNTTTSSLVFIPEAESHDVELICRAENPRVADSVIEDTWRLNVHYVPIVNLKMGSYLKPTYIKEGDDVYFECYVKANPKATKLSWIKDSQEIQQNASSGIILNGQSLVLQKVDFSASGDYTCLAENSKGSASSNPVSLQVSYSPVCNSEVKQVWGALRFEPIELSCIVDSSPQPTSFEWTINRNNHYHEVLHSLNIVKGHKSILRYIPSENRDFGTLSCWATNEVGRQEIPCTYEVVLVDRPSSLQNCSIVNQSVNSTIVLDCLPGFDGGLQQVFIMEVMELPSFNIRANITSNTTPNFEVADLDRGLNYSIYLFSANAKGRSEVVTIYTALEDKYAGIGSAFALSPVTASLLAVAAMMVGAAAAVSVAVYRRYSARRHTEQSVPPLHSVDSVESLPKRDNLPLNTLSQKVDYNTQYELKANGEVEDDMIPVHHDKKPLDDNSKSKVGEGSTAKIYSDHAASLPSNGNISFVNRGVTSRVSDLCFCEICIQNHLQSTRF